MSLQDSALFRFDPEIARAIIAEEARQTDTLDLIASENYTHPDVLTTNASVLTDKYAEGYPGRRYYAGQQHYDTIERLAIERAKTVFRAEHANVQPLSGSPMNQAVYFGLLKPGDTILAMDLSHGGHLTHGSPLSHMGKIFRFVRYKTSGANGDIDMDAVRALALENRPKLVLCGHSSYPREIDYTAFKHIAEEIGALTMGDVSHLGGLIAGGVLRNPLDEGFDVMTTTTHKTLRGPRGGLILARANDTITKKLNSLVFPGTQGGPLMHVIAAKAVAFLEALQPEFKQYQGQVLANARAMAAELVKRGFNIVSGGTDNHLFLLSLVGREITGKDADAALGRAHITVNKNAVPNDPRPPMIASGLRLGTPASTTRGFREAEITQVANWIADVLDAGGSDAVVARVRDQVAELCRRFPVYGD